MTRIIGSIRDFGGSDRHSNRAPRFDVVPAGTAARQHYLLSTVEVPVVLGPLMEFDFTILTSDERTPPAPVTFRLTWLDNAGNFTRVDEWKNIWLPQGQFEVGDLLAQAGVSETRVLWQAEEPNEHLMPVGALWVNTVTGDVNRRAA